MSLNLAILVPCLASRPWQRVVNHIAAQCERSQGRARVFYMLDKGEMTSGQKRHALCQMPEVRAAGYRCFVDDDDVVSDDYVESLLLGCESDSDVISFNLLFTHASKGRKDEVWRFGMYPNRRAKGTMCVNHLCAWKTSIADRVAWCPKLGYGDDHLWFQPLYHAGFARTNYHVDKLLYTYVFNPNVTANQRSGRISQGRAYVGRGLACFRLPDGEILVQDGHDAPEGHIDLRDRYNKTLRYYRRTLPERSYYHTATIA